MQLQSYPIIPTLQHYIKVICTMDGDTDNSHIRVLPDTCVELFINYTEKPIAIIDQKMHRGSIITCRMSKPMDIQMRKGNGCLAICFHPGMAYQFFTVPMHALTDTTVPLSELWKHKVVEIEEKLAVAFDNDSRAEIAQHYLLRQLAFDKKDLQIGLCLKQVQASGSLAAVSDLTNTVGISQRHLSRKFREYVGLPPKEYLRVSRFIQSLQYLKKYPAHSLTEIGYQSGYYDQSHFNRDYKAYTGHTPGELICAHHILY